MEHVFANFTSPMGRIALQVARTNAPCDSAFSDTKSFQGKVVEIRPVTVWSYMFYQLVLNGVKIFFLN